MKTANGDIVLWVATDRAGELGIHTSKPKLNEGGKWQSFGAVGCECSSGRMRNMLDVGADDNVVIKLIIKKEVEKEPPITPIQALEEIKKVTARTGYRRKAVRDILRRTGLTLEPWGSNEVEGTEDS